MKMLYCAFELITNLGSNGLRLPYLGRLQWEVDHYGRLHPGKVGIEVNRAGSAAWEYESQR